jgi:hypothetical protein
MKLYTNIINRFITIAVLCAISLCAGYEAHAGTSGESPPLAVSGYGLYALRPGPDPELADSGNSRQTKGWEIRLTNPSSDISSGAGTATNRNSPFTQRGSKSYGSYSLLAELGSLELSKLPPLFEDFTYRGARLSLGSGVWGNLVKLSAYTATSGSFGGAGSHTASGGREYHIAGATGDIGFLEGKGHVRTSLVTADEIPGIPVRVGPRTVHDGSIAEVTTSLDPFKGKIVAETDFTFSRTGNDSADESRDIYKSVYTLKLGGKAGSFGYHAAVEHGDNENILSGTAITSKGTDRYSIGSKVEQPGYSLSLDLSRLQSGTSEYGSQMKDIELEGKLACVYKGIRELPIAMQYSKSLDTETWAQSVGPAIKSETDTFSGDISYIEGMINWDLKGKFSRRKDLILQRPDQTVAAVSFSPRLILDDLSIAHSISVNRLYLYSDNSRTDSYVFKLGAKGKFPESVLNYELNGDFHRTDSTSSDVVTESICTKFRISTSIPQLFDGWKPPSVGINAEYKNDLKPAYGQDTFSLILSIETG